ncbi:MAG: CinA family protein [Brevundimonas sp.]|uniref:CinA family protein n=1 Tax=Brevundimonas sp. TaxID=1871086 RepID=UPI004033DA56
MFPEDIQFLARDVVAASIRRGVLLATAESCTGGLVAGALTAVPGSSAALDRGFVTYSNAAKSGMIGVPAALIVAHGAVSEPVARAMAEGAVARSDAALAVSITGIAGPGGGSADKPVGLVHFAAHDASGTVHAEHRFGDLGREAIRLASVRVALGLLLDRLGE